MSRGSQTSFSVVVCLVVASALAPCAAPAAEPCDVGFVDTAPFEDLAGEERLTVFISLGPTLMRMMGAAFNNADPELADSVAGLDSIRAVVIDISGADWREKGHQLLRATVRDLDRKRWERVAVVKETDVELHVLIRGTKDTVNGLVVVMEDKSEFQLVFVNICGIIDLAKIEELGREWNIPGMESVPNER